MDLSIVRPFRYVWKLFTKDDTPRQLAFGVALGMMIGLIPKGNLIAFGLAVSLCAFRVNLGAGLLTAFGVSTLASHFDPLLHGIGLRVLRNGAIYDLLSACYEMPVFPWTSLNNTVVLGGTIVGIVFFYPVYRLSERLFERHYHATKSMLARRLRWRREKTILQQPTDLLADGVLVEKSKWSRS